ncbi:ABC transporter ATP-binding protein [Leucobacter rhizosphaerae]|uniref:ABC transporter ATP-binding protein n=1 Tax=Leucobacter rhizosphaerae TaxID=2932245 RepID=A0ABY4FS51_9MICO|nr:ABC transporter ATP-binding protein [Leucobacter rhizosphaerae]UOQ59077.1 ABC transporter ATP-binding protein [Leucobacter rhizosphaerae]
MEPTSLRREHDNPAVRVEQVSMRFGGGEHENRVLENLNLSVEAGEFVSIVGPSGVGKTTLLRIFSGLIQPTAGHVYVEEEMIRQPHPSVGVVFQDYSRSLLPWMTTIENVAFPLEGRFDKKKRLALAEEALASVGLGGQGKKYPWEMSGGMQQRVAIARGIAYEAKIMLMDEPFASVDAQTRFSLEDLVADLQKRLGLTIILVTHDIDEALYLSDRVVVLAGKPASVVTVLDTDFGDHRDQAATKADPRFGQARTQILELLGHH